MKVTLNVVLMAIFIATAVSIIIWFLEFNSKYEFNGPWIDGALYALANPIAIPGLAWISIKAILCGFIPAFFILWVMNDLYEVGGKVRHLRGSQLVSSRKLDKTTRLKVSSSNSESDALQRQIEVGGIAIPLQSEPNHFLIVGSTNTGKSVAITEMLCSVMARGDRMVIIDPNGYFFSRFGRPEDKLLNPFDKRSQGWSIGNEIRKPYDYDRLAKCIIPDATDSSSQQWHTYAQKLLAEVAREMSCRGEMDDQNLLYWCTNAPTEKLREYLSGSAVAGLFDANAEKALASTRFILTTCLNPFQYLHSGDFSIRGWLESNEGNLFITWRQDMITALQPLISAWTDILVSSVLTLPSDNARPLWFFLDELASLKRLNSLEDSLTKGRKHGLRVVGCIQSTAQLDAHYGVHSATTLRSCFRSVLALGCSNLDPATAEFVSKGLGQAETERDVNTHTYSVSGTSRGVTSQRETQYAVLPVELMKLPPLHGYLKLAGDHPIANIHLTYQDHPVRNLPFQERT
tara:strand:- start:5646 stop:7196 length:1551 start_codon:yes stop_codon:yes gene_type:complete